MQRAIALSIAVLAFAGLCFFCLRTHAPMIQADVSGRVVQALAANHIGSAAVGVDGRDVVLSGPANSVQVSAATTQLVESVEGVREVTVHAVDAQPDASTVSRIPAAQDADVAKTESQNKLDTLLQQDVVEFDPSSAQLTAHGRAVLDQVVPVLLASPGLNCEIQGHTDSQGSAEVNQNLSYRRAIATKNYLVNKGVAAERLTTAGYGDTKPIASNDTPEGRPAEPAHQFCTKGETVIMQWLVGQMLTCLLLAGLLGVVFGWAWWGMRLRKSRERATDLEQRVAKLTGYPARLTDMEATHAAYVASKNEEEAKFKARIAELEPFAAKVPELQQTLAAKTTDGDVLRTQLTALQAKFDDVESQHKASLAGSAAKDSVIAEHVQAHQDKDARLASLTGRIAELEPGAAKAPLLEEQISHHIDAHKEKDEHLEQLMSQVDELKAAHAAKDSNTYSYQAAT